MKLFHISQTENNNWDTFDSAVVAAETDKDARNIHPIRDGWEPGDGTWCSSPDKVIVRYLGEARKGTLPGVICASFNAG